MIYSRGFNWSDVAKRTGINRSTFHFKISGRKYYYFTAHEKLLIKKALIEIFLEAMDDETIPEFLKQKPK
jgi:hypothetical protein